MRLRPNDLPCMIEGEERMITFKLSAVTGDNTIDAFTITSDSHSFGTPTISNSNVHVMATANRSGECTIKANITLSNDEILIGKVRSKVEAATSSERY